MVSYMTWCITKITLRFEHEDDFNDQVKAWRPLVEQVWGKIKLPLVLDFLCFTTHKVTDHTVRGKPCVGPCGQQGERYWWCRYLLWNGIRPRQHFTMYLSWFQKNYLTGMMLKAPQAGTIALPLVRWVGFLRVHTWDSLPCCISGVLVFSRLKGHSTLFYAGASSWLHGSWPCLSW